MVLQKIEQYLLKTISLFVALVDNYIPDEKKLRVVLYFLLLMILILEIAIVIFIEQVLFILALAPILITLYASISACVILLRHFTPRISRIGYSAVRYFSPYTNEPGGLGFIVTLQFAYTIFNLFLILSSKDILRILLDFFFVIIFTITFLFILLMFFKSSKLNPHLILRELEWKIVINKKLPLFERWDAANSYYDLSNRKNIFDSRPISANLNYLEAEGQILSSKESEQLKKEIESRLTRFKTANASPRGALPPLVRHRPNPPPGWQRGKSSACLAG